MALFCNICKHPVNVTRKFANKTSHLSISHLLMPHHLHIHNKTRTYPNLNAVKKIDILLETFAILLSKVALRISAEFITFYFYEISMVILL